MTQSSDPSAPIDHEVGSAFAYWEEKYSAAEGIWSGNVNEALAVTLADQQPGSVLDLGAGEGGDAIWLAQRGWQATALDLSPTALARGEAQARRAGLDESITWIAADLQSWSTEQQFDLVSACFLHSRAELDRAGVLKKAVNWVAPGGLLLVVGHAEPPPWTAASGHRPMDCPSPREDLETLNLDENWVTLLAEVRDRQSFSPAGEPAVMRDGVLLVQRAG